MTYSPNFDLVSPLCKSCKDLPAIQIAYSDLTVKKAISNAGLPVRVTGGNDKAVWITFDTDRQYRTIVDNQWVFIVGLKKFSSCQTVEIFYRAAEILAYSFHDYIARESLKKNR